MNSSPGQPDPNLLEELVRRIVAICHPLRIILFGSAARGEMDPDSDLDVLVVMPDGVATAEIEKAVYRGLWGLGAGADIIAVTERHVREYGANPNLVIHPAINQGKELYRAAG